MRLRAHIIIAVLIALLSQAVAADPVDTKRYVALRSKFASGISLATFSSSPASYAGKVFEIRGRLSGSFSAGDSASIIVATSEGKSFIIAAAKPPQDAPGVELATLSDVSPSGELILRAWTYNAELRRYEQSLRPAQAPKPAAEQEPAAAHAVQNKTSRGSKTYTVTREQMVQSYKNAIKQFNRKLSDTQADTIARSILGFSDKYQVDARLVCAVILAESNFRIGARSRAGAMGLGQLMPTTAAGLGVNNAYDPVDNIYGSTRYIKSVLDRMTGNKKWDDLTWHDLALGLAAYNAGPGAVKRHGGIPPYKETQNYVRKVTEIYKRLCGVK